MLFSFWILCNKQLDAGANRSRKAAPADQTIVVALSRIMWQTRILIKETSLLMLPQMITAGQLRASRALLGIDQSKLAKAAGLSLPTIQRMELSEGVIRGNVNSLMKLVGALDALGIDLIAHNASSQSGGRGVRLKRPAP